MENKETRYNLPDSWIWTTLGEIGIVTSGGTPSSRQPDFWGGDIAWITPADLSNYKNKYIEQGQRSITKIGLDNSSAKLLPKGTVMFSSRAPIGYTVIAKNEIATNQGFKNLILTKSGYPDYIYYYLQSSKQLAESYASGTTFLELSATKFSQIPIPLPPLSEQYRIVEKIEELFSELDKTQENLLNAQKQLEIYRQVVLKDAFEGKLTSDFRRASHLDINILFEKIIKEKNEKGFKKNKSTFDDKLVSSINYNIPVEWKKVNIDFISLFITDFQANGSFSSLSKTVQTYSQPNYAVLVRLYDLRRDLKNNDLLYTDKIGYDFLRKSFLNEGDFLVANVGAGFGTTLIMPKHNFKATLAPNMYKVLLSDNLIKKMYFYFCQSLIYWEQIKSLSSGSGQPKMNKSQYRSIIVPLIPFIEQKQIVQEIEYRFTLIENLEKSINDNLKRIAIFKHIILRKAFSGKLVPLNVNDEPADELLERLKEEIRIYQIQQKEIVKSKPQKLVFMESNKTVKELLEEATEPMEAKEVWQRSVHKDDIEKFYEELKKISADIEEIREGKISKIFLKK